MTRTLLRAAALSLFALLGFAACTGGDLPGGACSTCADVYTNGGIVCGPGPSADAWRTLSDCACGSGPCFSACTGAGNFCTTGPATKDCSMCLADSCAAATAQCAAN